MRYCLLLCIGLCASPFLAFAGSMGSQTSSVEADVQRELVRRQEDLVTANKLVAEGDKAMKDKDYETAYVKYLQALDLIGSGSINKPLRDQVLAKFSSAGVSYAEKLVNDGRYNEAEKVAKTILLPQYNPTYKPAVQFLSNLEQSDYFNKTITPQFAGNREEVKQLLVDAEGFVSSGRYDLAMKRYEQVLNIDPYNIAARKGQEQISNLKQKYYQSAYNETRSRLLWQVGQNWADPVKKFNSRDNIDIRANSYDPGTAKIIAKLNHIVLPKVVIPESTTIREAINYLQQQSVIYDTSEQDPHKKGVNIFLKLPQAGAAAANTASTASPSATPGAAPGVDTGNGASSVPSADTVVSLNLNNIPLYEALKYLARAANMKLKVEPYAVDIVPETEPTESLISRTFQIPAGFIPAQSAESAQPTAVAGAPSSASSAPKITGRANAKDYLESQQIPFPPGATAIYNPNSSTLTVRNTPTNIDAIEELVDAAWRGLPQQVQIESKFLEVSQDNLKELGFDWLLGPFQINGTGAYGAGGTQGYGQTVQASNYPILNPGGTPVGQDPITGGLRTGSQAITPTSIEGVIAQQSRALNGGVPGPGPGIFSLAGVFTNPQFQVVIRALNQKRGIDLMAAPSVTTKSGEKATIDIVREFRYPTQFTPPQIPQTVSAPASTSTTGATVPFISTATITPTTPSQFETKNTGVSLEINPKVAADGYTIDLDLKPQVIDFEGFINYGTPILGINVKNFIPVTVTLSQNVINQPIFNTRVVVTSVSIYDGQTVVLGGLIREDIQKVEDKVPILGDIPLVGRAFRASDEEKTKYNLVIFVTAHLVDAQGNFLRTNEEEEDTVTPIGVPEDLPKPQMNVIRGK